MKKFFAICTFLITALVSLSAEDLLLTPVAVVDLIYPEPIYLEDLNNSYDEAMIYASQLNAPVTKKLILEGLIEEKLLLQGAEDAGIVVASSDVDQMVRQYKSLLENSIGATLTDEQFETVVLKELGVTKADLRKNLKNQYAIESYIRQEKSELLATITTPTESEVFEVYNEYISQFTLGKSINVFHVFISNENRTDEEAYQLASDISWDIQTGKISFEDAVMTYTDDTESQFNGGELGWIALNNTAVRQEMGQSFVSGAFAQKIGVVSDPVQSNFGYHVMLVKDSKPARILDLDEPLSFGSTVTVRQSIQQQIYLAKQTALYQQAQSELILELRDQAGIDYLIEVE